MRLIDYGYVAVLVALWGAVFRFRVRARAAGELWWMLACVVAVLTLKVGVIADPFNGLTGGVYLDQLLIHLIGIAIAALALSWLVHTRYGTRRPYRRVRIGGAVLMPAFLVVTWFAAPVYDIPDDSEWIPAYVQVAPAMAVHWVGFHACMVAFTAAFVALALPIARTPGRDPVALSMRLMVAAAALFGLKSGVEAVAQVAVLATGRAEPEWLVRAVNPVVLVVFALFMAAVLVRREGVMPEAR